MTVLQSHTSSPCKRIEMKLNSSSSANLECRIQRRSNSTNQKCWATSSPSVTVSNCSGVTCFCVKDKLFILHITYSLVLLDSAFSMTAADQDCLSRAANMHVCSRYSGGSHKPLVEQRQEEEPVGGLPCSLKNTDLGS